MILKVNMLNKIQYIYPNLKSMRKHYLLLIAFFISFAATAQTINFADRDLETVLASYASPQSNIAKDINGNNIRIDTNNDLRIQRSEALNVYQININNYWGDFTSISDLGGIEQFPNLTHLNCGSIYLDAIDVRALSNLQELRCDFTFADELHIAGLSNLKLLSCKQVNASNIDLSGLTSLESFEALNAGFTSLDFSECPNLVSFSFLVSNYLTSLTLSNLPRLETIYIGDGGRTPNVTLNNLPSLRILYCEESHIDNLNLSGLYNLEELRCSENNISNLNLMGFNKLRIIRCNDNQIAGNLNVSEMPLLTELYCHNNNLSGLFIKNGFNWSASTYNIFFGNSNLRYICAEDDQYNFLRNKVYQSGMNQSDVEINSYCTFAPGGNYFSLQGQTVFDLDGNGCNASDLNMTNMHFVINDGISNGSVFSDDSGTYAIRVKPGNYTVTPRLEIPEYFTISPETISISAPTEGNVVNQNFCVTANGTHPDLEVALLPLDEARPGFDAFYKISYRNKGTHTQSGTVSLTFQDYYMDFVTSNPTVSGQVTNQLLWTFDDLKPFETRTIAITMNLNTPLESAPLNNGSLLLYDAAISSALTDETPADNTSHLRETVVNSFDPNDKTCLEGTTISPDAVGKNVHYMIRFENTGTASARNIVVKDVIDLDKFDIHSLVPIPGSHPFVTKITEPNIVEFFLENINLPFYDAHNDGFVAFKIKTNDNLQVGNSFSNTAGIYFDYNFPIVTNTATTTIATLAASDFNFSDNIRLAPNPANNILNLQTNQITRLSSIEIYNALGQPVLLIPNAEKTTTIDVSSLNSGHYFIKVHTEKGPSNSSFIKI